MIETISGPLIPIPNSTVRTNAQVGKVKVSLDNSAETPKKSNKIGELTEGEQKQVDELKQIDKEVRAHEMAHKNAGGQYASNPTYSYTVGPDNQRYATSGEVQIDASPIDGDPEATIAKMDVVIAAALAPAEPSSQDRKVAATAVTTRNQARAELLSQKKEKENGDSVNKPFDINNFGETSTISAQKAYQGGFELNQGTSRSGQIFSIIS